MKATAISVVIPVLKDKDFLTKSIKDFCDKNHSNNFEIIVVDGSENAETINSLAQTNIIKLTSKKGRGIQMNTGAKSAKNDTLLFLHCDTLLPTNSINLILDSLNKTNADYGVFKLKIDSEKFFLKLVSIFANLRTKFFKLPYGDQAFFIRKSVFNEIKGFKNIPIMEDVEIVLRLKKLKKKMVIIDEVAVTSSRKWDKDGIFINSFKNLFLLLLFLLGFKPEKLYKMYYN